jgi:SnoaL-like domain
MGSAEVELVSRVQKAFEGDLVPAPDDDALIESVRELIDPAAEIHFRESEGGALGDRLVPERGLEGLREGWRDWLEPWEHFWIRFEELVDAGDGKVLSLAELCGQLPGGAEITQAGAALITVSDGKVVAADFYVDQNRARRDAGLE